MSVVCDRACRAQLLKFWSKVMSCMYNVMYVCNVLEYIIVHVCMLYY